ncbi:MAG: glycosyltransferase [Desulfomicrobium sp.]
MTPLGFSSPRKQPAARSEAMSAGTDYSAERVRLPDGSVDVRVLREGRVQHLGGKRGVENELRRVADIPAEGVLPVFLGCGLGAGLADMLARTAGPVAVVDAESAIGALTGAPGNWRDDPRVFWIDQADPEAALDQLTRWQIRHGGLPFAPVRDPFYARLRPALYRDLADRLEISRKVDFWSRARYPKFRSSVPRVLLLTSSYFLMGELEAAFTRLGYATSLVQLPSQEVGSQEFVESILSEILAFHPDFVLTINHLGVDKEGILTALLARMELPLASWFVDNPHLILYVYENLASDWVTLFTWDVDNIESLKAQGFSRVHYLPLATDPHRFAYAPGTTFQRDVAFVGNSMLYKVHAKLRHYDFPPALLGDFEDLGQAFMESGSLSVKRFLEEERPEHLKAFLELPDVDTRLAFETLITWQATLLYRLRRVRELLPFNPLLVGDPGWREILPKGGWTYHRELNYYADLPTFYPATRINFNCTSQQMKGAVNQRVFDVPVCGGFLLTDHRRQMEALFEPGREIVCYQEPGEIAGLVRHYLRHDGEREKIIQAARARILAEHTYDLRLESLVRTMRSIYG